MKIVKIVHFKGGSKAFQMKGDKSAKSYSLDKYLEVPSILFSKACDFTGRTIKFNAFICDCCKEVCRTMDESPIDSVCEKCEAKRD